MPSYLVWYFMWWGYMLYRISSEPGYLRADLFQRETVAEAGEFFAAVADIAARRNHSSILISVHSSSPLFTIERSGFLKEFEALSAAPGHRIALVADSKELNQSHEYLELLAQRHGINARHFRAEVSALEWLTPRSQLPPQLAHRVWRPS